MKGEAELKAEIDKYLTEMINEGFIDNLLQEHGVE